MVNGPHEIPQPLDERALKYGRNVLIVGCITLTLAFVPYIEVSKFKPFGFDLSQSGEVSVWGLLAIVLIYYSAHFWIACRMEYKAWTADYGGKVRYKPTPHKGIPGAKDTNQRNYRTTFFMKRFWFLDFGLPTTVGILGVCTAIYNVASLWPTQ
jgi:hypothetical protein